MRAHDRLYLQYQPSETSRDRLLTIQKTAIAVNPQGVAVQPDRLHLTLIHFGILADVYRELHEQQPDLTKEFFYQTTEQFVRESQVLLPTHSSVYPEKLELFGSRASVLALRVRVSSELQEAHAQALALLERHITTCGINPARLFMQGSPNFRFTLRLEPHISLLNAAREVPDGPIDTSTPLQLQVMPVVYN